MFWVVIFLLILQSIDIIKFSINYVGYCGNPLTDAWNSWYIDSIVILIVISLALFIPMIRSKQIIGKILYLLLLFGVFFFGGIYLGRY